MKDRKRRSGDLSMDVAAALKLAASEVNVTNDGIPDKAEKLVNKTTNVKKNSNDESNKITINTAIYISDMNSFQSLKQFLLSKSDSHQLFLSDVFKEGLSLLKEMVNFPEVKQKNVLRPSNGRRLGSSTHINLTPEEQKKTKIKRTTVLLSQEVLDLYNDYKTYMVKINSDINYADLFKNILDAVNKKYKGDN